jgi:hypothetical protein
MRTRPRRRTLFALTTALLTVAVTAIGVGIAAPAATAATSVTVTPGQGKSVSLGGTASDHPSAQFTLAALPKGSASTYVGVRARVAGSAYYLLQARVLPTGGITVTVKRRAANGVITDLAGPATVPFTTAAGSPLVADLTVSGTSSVSLKGFVTNAAGKRYDVSVSDSAATRLVRTATADAWLYASPGAGAGATVSIAPAPTTSPTSPTPPGSGVPGGTKLTVHEGDIIIDKPNTVISNMEIHGFVRVNAPGAVIQNSVITGRATSAGVAIVSNYPNHSSFVIRDTEIYAKAASPYLNGIMGDHFTATRVWIHDVVDGVRITGSNVTLTDSIVEKNLHYQFDPTQNNTPSHDDSIQIQGGSNITITGNRLSGAFNSAVQVTEGLGTVSNMTIAGNYLNGGGCTVNIFAAVGLPAIAGSAVHNNTFGPTRRVNNCAVVASMNSIPSMVSNIWESTGASVVITRGK